jgi:hypothetical protein
MIPSLGTLVGGGGIATCGGVTLNCELCVHGGVVVGFSMRPGRVTSGRTLDCASGVGIESTELVGLKLGTDIGPPTNSVAVTRMTSL